MKKGNSSFWGVLKILWFLMMFLGFLKIFSIFNFLFRTQIYILSNFFIINLLMWSFFIGL